MKRWIMPAAALMAIAIAFGLRATSTANHSDDATAALGPNRANEPLREEASLDLAVTFIDRTAQEWQARRNCVTCHTNGLYLITRPVVGPDGPEIAEARAFAQSYLDEYLLHGKQPRGQHGSIEGIVATSALLAISDAQTTGELHPSTRRGLDYIWTQLSDEGCWDAWLKCHWGPFEVDDHFGVTLAALAVGMAPDDYAESDTGRPGLARLIAWLEAHPPTTAHQKAMTLWAAQYVPGIADAVKQQKWIDELAALQQPDGGWVLVQLGDERWSREDGGPQDQHSDGYATGFVVYVLRQAGVPANDPRIERGIAWLKANQRESGRWFTRSPRRDRHHYITHAATQFAILALKACEE